MVFTKSVNGKARFLSQVVKLNSLHYIHSNYYLAFMILPSFILSKNYLPVAPTEVKCLVKFVLIKVFVKPTEEYLHSQLKLFIFRTES